MNTVAKHITLAGFCLFATNAMAHASQFEATDNRATTQICVAAAQGKTFKLHRAIKESRLSKQFVAQQVKCNNQPITEFVATHSTKSETINHYLTGGRYQTQSDTLLADN